jgi:transcriptional regulator with XRE-family HTH domain
MNIIERIIEERKKQKLSQEELGALAGMARAYISRIEIGNVDVSLSRIERILEALGYELTIRKKR